MRYEINIQTGETFELPDFPPEAPDLENRLAEVTSERDHRRADGIWFQGHKFQTREFDQRNIAGMHQAAMSAMLAGKVAGDYYWFSPEVPFAWISEDNDLVPMDAPTMMEFARQVAFREMALVFAGRVIKDKIEAGITVDIKVDDNWAI